jgi:hypothetical protein
MSASIIDIRLTNDRISVGRFFSVHFQRTLRLPNDGRDYPLPPGFGAFPIRAVADYPTKTPAVWRDGGGFFLPMHRHEALWLSFACPRWHPTAVRVEAGGVCALTGAHKATQLTADPQNYMVAPEQPWLDGIKAGDGVIRQFVASPLGEGQTIEAQVTQAESAGGIQITVVDAVSGVFPDKEPTYRRHEYSDDPAGWTGSSDWNSSMMVCESVTSMGLGAGGRMVQKIYPDLYGIDTWNVESAATVHIHLVDARDWPAITGEAAPCSPISVRTYKRLGLPWFALADHNDPDLPVSPVLAGLKPVMFDGGSFDE